MHTHTHTSKRCWTSACISEAPIILIINYFALGSQNSALEKTTVVP